MNNRYSYAAIVFIVIVVLSYFIHFYYVLNYSISKDTAAWAQFGDYMGGVLNPVLSFIALVLLIQSLKLQNEANNSLKEELKNNEKAEKLKIFEIHFFNMLNFQSMAFESFNIKIKENDANVIKKGVNAIIEIEEGIAIFREKQKSDNEIKQFLENIDMNDQIFSATRRFYVLVKIISEKLSDTNGFSENERRTHLLTLINFTDFSLLRLIMMSMQFMNYQSTEYLKKHKEFNSVLQEVGINWNLY